MKRNTDTTSVAHIYTLKGNTHKIQHGTMDLNSEGVEMVERELLVRKMKCGVMVDNTPAGKLG